MNLLDRFISISKFLKPGIIVMIPVFLSCDTSTDIGIEYDLDSNANVKLVELNLPATNIFIDSLRTDDENRVLVGNYIDEIGGRVSTEAYFQLGYERGPMPREAEFIENDTLQDGTIVEVLITPEDTLKLDSIIVTFETNATIPISGTALQDFRLHDLTDSLIRGAVYLSELSASKDRLVGAFTDEINLELDTLLSFKLDQDYSNAFFEQLSEIARDSNRFIFTEVLQSMGLFPEIASNTITSLNLASDTTRLWMYTSPVDQNAKDTTYITSFNFTDKNYSYINRDDSNYGSLNDRDEITLSNNQVIIDPLYGISAKFSFAELEAFFEENENIFINNASIASEFISEAKRDTLENFFTFISRNDDFNGSGIVNNTFENLVLNDRGLPAISVLSENNDKLITTSTLFFQSVYDNYIEQGEISVEVAEDEFSPFDKFVFFSTVDVTLQRALLESNSIKLLIYYTEVDQ